MTVPAPRWTKRRVVVAATSAALLFAASTLALADTPATAAGCAGITPTGGGWQRIAAPRFPSGTQGLAAYAVSGDASTLFATNGTVVERSADGGCAWSATYTLSSAPTASPVLVSSAARITSIVTGAAGDVYLVVADAGHPHVIASTDGGSSWADAETGIVGAAAAPTPAQLVAAPAAGTLYLLASGLGSGPALPVLGSSAGLDVLFTSTDSGATWTARPLQPELVAAGFPAGVRANQLAVDPRTDTGLWLATSAGLASSADGGASWALANTGGSGALGAVTVSDPAGSPGATVAAFAADAATAYVSTNGGVSGSWSTFPAPAVVSAASLPAGSPIYVASDVGQLFTLNPGGRTLTLLWAGPPGLTDPTPALASSALGSTTVPVLYACRCVASGGGSAIYRQVQSAAVGTVGLPTLPSASPSTGNGSCNLAGVPMTSRDWGKPAFTPTARQVVLGVGQSATVAEPVYLPPRQMDVDVVADLGGDSAEFWCPVKFGQLLVASQLSQVRNLAVGLGEFGDYPGFGGAPLLSGGASGTSATVYARVRPIGPVDAAFAAASAAEPDASENGSPQGDGGGLAALYQAVTGAGQALFIPSGGQAGFAPAAYRVVATVALAHLENPADTPGYPGPAFSTVTSALTDRGVHQVGIWVQNNNKNASADTRAFTDLRSLATATGGVAPAPVDCGVTGYFATTIPTGGPLVCPYTSPVDATVADPQLGRELLALLASLRDVEPVHLVILAGGGPGIRLSPATYPGLDLLTEPHRLPASLRLVCGGAGSRLVQIGAEAYGQVLAVANIELTCTAPAVPPPPLRAFVPPPLPPGAPQPVTNPNPVQAPVANVVVNPAPQPVQVPQAQPQPVAQAVVVPQPQTQPQLAYQRAANEANQSEAMSALPPGRDAVLRLGEWLLLAGGGVAFAAGCALRRRVVRAFVWGARSTGPHRPGDRSGRVR